MAMVDGAVGWVGEGEVVLDGEVRKSGIGAVNSGRGARGYPEKKGENGESGKDGEHNGDGNTATNFP